MVRGRGFGREVSKGLQRCQKGCRRREGCIDGDANKSKAIPKDDSIEKAQPLKSKGYSARWVASGPWDSVSSQTLPRERVSSPSKLSESRKAQSIRKKPGGIGLLDGEGEQPSVKLTISFSSLVYRRFGVGLDFNYLRLPPLVLACRDH